MSKDSRATVFKELQVGQRFYVPNADHPCYGFMMVRVCYADNTNGQSLTDERIKRTFLMNETVMAYDI